MENTIKRMKKSNSETLLKKLVSPKATAIEKAAIRKVLKERKVDIPKIKRVGVIQSIFNTIDKKPITFEGILLLLSKSFPDKNAKSMMNTIKAQIGTKKQPTRMERERKVTFVFTEKDGIRYVALK